MADLTRNDITSKRLRVVPLDIPEWDGTVYIREWSFAETMNYAKSVSDSDSSSDMAALRICAECMCDSGGTLLFEPRNEADIKLLGKCSLSAIKQIAEAALKLNGLSESGTAEKK